MKRLLPLFACPVFVLVLLVASAISVLAQEYPRTMSVQGYLTDPVTGGPIRDEKCTLLIKIYPNETSDEVLSQRLLPDVQLHEGIFNVEINSLDGVFTDSITGPGYGQPEFYVGITVENDSELKPRTKLTASPYALSVDPSAAVTRIRFSDTDTVPMSGYIAVEAGEGISFAPGGGPNSVKISATGVGIDSTAWHVGGNSVPNSAPISSIFGTLGTTSIDIRTEDISAIIIDGATQDVNILSNLDVDSNLNIDGATTLDGTLDQTGDGQVTFSGNVNANNGLDIVGGDLTVATNIDVTGNATLNGNVALGDAAADIITLNGTLTGADSGHSLGTAATDATVLSILGDANNVGQYELFVDGDVRITGLLAFSNLTSGSVVYVDSDGALATDSPLFTYDDGTNTMTTKNIVITDSSDLRGPIANSTGHLNLNDSVDVIGILDAQITIVNTKDVVVVNDSLKVTGNGDVDGNLNVDGTSTLVGAVDAQAASNLFGNGVAIRQLTVQGIADAVIGNTIGTNPAVWDQVVEGDLGVIGIIKSGGSIWIDGVNDEISSNGALSVTTTVGSGADITINSDGGTTTVDDDLVVTGTSDLQGNVSNSTGDVVVDDNLNVTGSADIDTDLNVDGATTLNGNVDLGDAGADAVTLNGTLTGAGAGHLLGTAALDATVLSILGDANNVGQYELFVDGDVQITGLLSLPSLNANSVVVTDAVGNLITDTEFTYDATTNVVNIQGTVVNSTGSLTIDDDLNVTSSADIDTDLNVDGNTTHVGTLDQQGTVANSTGDVVVDDNLNVTGSADIDTDLNVDGNTTLNGAVDLGDAGADAVTLNGTLTGAGAGHLLGTAALDATVLSILGDPNNVGQYELFVDGDVQITGLLSLPSLNANSVVVTDAVGNLITDTEFTYDATTNVVDIQGTVVNSTGDVTVDDNLDVNTNLNVDGTSTLVGVVDAQAAANTIGDGAAVRQLTVEGTADAVIGNTIAGNPAVWDQVIEGDLGVTGIIKLGGSIWIDGVNDEISSNGALSVTTTVGSGADITINSDGGTTTVDDDLVVTGTSDLQGNVSNSTGDVVVDDNLNVTGSADIDTDLNVDGNTTLNGAVDLGDAGADAVTLNGTLTGAGAGHLLGTAALDATVLSILGDPNNVGQYELFVDGDVQITGLLSLPSLNANSVVVTDAVGNLITDTEFTYDATTNVVDIQGTVVNSTGDVTVDDNLDVNTNLNVDGTSTLVGVVDAQAAANTIGDGAAVRQLTVEGTADAVIGNTIGTNPAVWDQVVEGDLGVIGIIKSGGSIWIDGVNDEISSNGALSVTTTVGSGADITINSDGGTTTVDDDLVVTGTSDLQGNVSNSTGDVVVDDNLNVTGSADIDTDLNVDGNTTLNGAVDLGDAGADAVTLNGTLTGAGAGHLLGTAALDATVLSILGDANNVGQYELFVDGDVQITGLLSLPSLNANSVVVTDAVGNLITDTEFTYDATTNVVNIQGTVVNSTGDVTVDDNLDVNTNLNVDGTSTLVGVVDAQAAANTIGDGAAVRQLTVEGTADAVIGNTIAGNPAVWDQVIEGDLGVTGIIKLGGSIWIDGVNDEISSNGALSVTTTVGSGADITINSDGGTTTVDDDLVVTGTSDLQGNVSNSTGDVVVDDNLNVTGSADIDTDLNVDGITTLDETTVDGTFDQTGGAQVTLSGNVDANNGLDVTGAATVAGTVTQTGGGQVTFSGNIDAQNGVDVAGGDLNVVTNANITGNLGVDGNTTLGNNAADAITANGVLTAINTTNLNGDVNLGDAAVDAITLNGTLTGAGNGHSLGTLASDATVLTINGLANAAPAYELIVNGDVQITGLLSLPGFTPNAVMFVDAAGNMVTEVAAGDFYWDETNNRLGIGNGGVAPTEALDVTGNIEATGTIQSGTSIIIDGTTPGNHNISTTIGEDLTIIPGGGDLIVTGNTNITGSADVDMNLNVDGTSTLVEAVDAQAAANTIGNGAAVTQLTVEGTADAAIGNTIAGNAIVWDQVVEGDLGITGIINSGGSFWIDGANSEIRSNSGIVIGTTAGSASNITLDSDGGTTTVDDNLDVTANIEVDGNIELTTVGGFIENTAGDFVQLNDGLDVLGPIVNSASAGIEFGSDIDINGFSLIDNIDGEVGVDDNLKVTGGVDVDMDLNVDVNTTLNGNVDLGDAGADAVTLNGTLTGAGAGHSLGTAATDATVLSILGDANNVGQYELFVDGDVQITGLLSLPGFGANSVVVTDAAGNLITDTEFTYDATTNIVDIQGTIVNSGVNNVTVNDNLDVNTNLNVDGNTVHVGPLDQQGPIGNSSGDIFVDDNIVPTADNTYSIGIDATRWTDVFINGGSVHIGPSGGEAGNTELALDYAANTGSINVDGGGSEIDVTIAATTVNNNLDAVAGVDVTNAPLTVGGANFSVDNTSGNMVVGGTLDVAGDVDINTGNFTVTAASGNTDVGGTLDVTSAVTFDAHSGGGNQSLYVDNTGVVQSSNATAAQNATGLFSGSGVVITPVVTQTALEANVVAGSIIHVTIESVAGPPNPFYINAIVPNTSFTVNFATPPNIGDVIHYTIINP